MGGDQSWSPPGRRTHVRGTWSHTDREQTYTGRLAQRVALMLRQTPELAARAILSADGHTLCVFWRDQ